MRRCSDCLSDTEETDGTRCLRCELDASRSACGRLAALVDDAYASTETRLLRLRRDLEDARKRGKEHRSKARGWRRHAQTLAHRLLGYGAGRDETVRLALTLRVERRSGVAEGLPGPALPADLLRTIEELRLQLQDAQRRAAEAARERDDAQARALDTLTVLSALLRDQKRAASAAEKSGDPA